MIIVVLWVAWLALAWSWLAAGSESDRRRR